MVVLIVQACSQQQVAFMGERGVVRFVDAQPTSVHGNASASSQQHVPVSSLCTPRIRFVASARVRKELHEAMNCGSRDKRQSAPWTNSISHSTELRDPGHRTSVTWTPLPFPRFTLVRYLLLRSRCTTYGG
jgi:hypothetical protein